jgi:membrane-associated HD superfamily phosphohydrolase
MLTFFGTVIGLGMSSEQPGIGLSRRIGVLVMIGLAVLAGVGSALYLEARFNPSDILMITIGIAMTIFALIAVGILAMSRPDWRRAILAMVIALVAAAVVTIVFERLAVLAGGGRFVRWFFNIALLATVRAFLMVIFCSMAAYAFARM